MHKRSAQDPAFNEASPTKVLVSQSGSTPQQQRRAVYTSEAYGPHQQQYTAYSAGQHQQQPWGWEQPAPAAQVAAITQIHPCQRDAQPALTAADATRPYAAQRQQQNGSTGAAGCIGAQQQQQQQQQLMQQCGTQLASTSRNAPLQQKPRQWQQQHQQVNALQQQQHQQEHRIIAPHLQQQQQQVPQEQPPCFQQQCSPSPQQGWSQQAAAMQGQDNHHNQQQQRGQATADHTTRSHHHQQQQEGQHGWVPEAHPSQQDASPAFQPQQLPQQRGTAMQQQTQPVGPALQQQQQQQHGISSCHTPQYQVPAWQQQQQTIPNSVQQAFTSLPQQRWQQQQQRDLSSPLPWQQQQQPSMQSPRTPAAAAAGSSLNTLGWAPASPTPLPSLTTNTNCVTNNCMTPSPTTATTLPGSSSRGCSRFPSIWKSIRHSLQLQQAAVKGEKEDIEVLCGVLCLDARHVRHEVVRLQKWFQLTFWLRVVLEQYCVLDFVSPRTLLQLPHLPPQHITLLDVWLKEDMAAAAAASGGAAGCAGAFSNQLLTDRLSTKYNSYWTANDVKGPATTFRDLPPSWAITQLLIMGRLKWVPAAAAAACNSAAGPFTAAGHGTYTWHHGPTDAWLCSDGSSSSEAAAARSMRAEQLRGTTYPRVQAKLLLNTSCMQQQQQQQYSPLIGTSSSTSSVLNPTDALGYGVLELGFRSEDLSHTASCHLQRHPVLADHDRLIRVTMSSKAAAAAAAGSSSSGDASGALDGVLTQGVLLAGRRYQRLVQKDVGNSSESLWLVACESVCPEDTSGPHAWPNTNPAAARQMLGAFSSLPTISKQSARGALLVSSTLPLQIQAHNIIYIPDITGPTDTFGNMTPQPQHNSNASGSSSSSSSLSSDLVLSDGSGFMSADVSLLVPAVSAGEVVAADRGGGATWPGGPVQVRVFDAHCGGVIAKGTLTPLSQAVLPPQTIILRASQVKAPAAKQFWQKWSGHWNNMLIWAHQQHQQQQQSEGQGRWQQQQRGVRQPGQVAVLRGKQQQQQQQLIEDVRNFSLQQPTVAAAPAAAAAAVMDRCLPSASGHGGLQGQQHQQHQQQQHQQHGYGIVRINSTSSTSTSSRQTCLITQAAAAAAAAAYCESRRPILVLIHPQDRLWFQQIWFVHDALQLWASSSSSSSTGTTQPRIAPPPHACQPPAAAAASSSYIIPHTTPYHSSSSGQTAASGLSCSPVCPMGLANSSSSSVGCCCCSAVLEVVSRAPSCCERSGDLRINKNLMLLLHDAGVPQHVFEEWCDIEQHKLTGIDTSYDLAYAAARAIGATEVINKLEALIGVQLTHPDLSSSSSSSNLSTAPAATTGAHATGFSRDMSSQLVFKPDLALKQDLHDIKVRRCQKLALMSLPVPSAQDTADAVAAGVIRAEGNMLLTRNAAGGVRLLGIPDPSCGCVPEGCVAVSPGLVPPTGQAVIYRDPGIHPGDVRRVRVIPYPQHLLTLLPPQFSGAMFFPTVGSSCLGASLAGGDYDGDIYLLLWDQRVVTWFRAQDPAPYVAPGAQSAPLGGAAAAGKQGLIRPQRGNDICGGGGGGGGLAADGGGGGGGGVCETKGDVWGIPEGYEWQHVEEMLTAYYRFCGRVSGAMKEAHTLWECYADKCGVASCYCLNLAQAYNEAIDAPKTGKEPNIQDMYRHNCMVGVDINKLPSWHSRVIKEAAKPSGRQAVAAAKGFSRDPPAVCRGRSIVVRSLWSRIHDLSPVDYLDPSLLDLDPDLVLQSGPCGVSSEVMKELIDKWDRLYNEWNISWARLMRKGNSARTSSDQQSLIDEKAELQSMLKARFQVELWGGLEALEPDLAAAAAAGSRSILDRTLMEASACYQAVYRQAKAKQDRLRSLTEEQRNSRNRAAGYEDMPRVAMAWRVAGQWLRLLKATTPLRVHAAQQALIMQELQRLREETGDRTTALAGLQGLRGLYMGGRAGSSRVELGSLQHPYLAAVVAQQQSRRSQLRGNWGAAASLGDGL